MPLLQSNFNDQNERFQEVQLLPGMLQVVYTRDVQEKGLLRKSVVMLYVVKWMMNGIGCNV